MEMLHKKNTPPNAVNVMTSPVPGFDHHAIQFLPYPYRPHPDLVDRFQHLSLSQGALTNSTFVRPNASVLRTTTTVPNHTDNAIQDTSLESSTTPTGGQTVASMNRTPLMPVASNNKLDHYSQPGSTTQQHQSFPSSVGKDNESRPNHPMLVPQDEIILADTSSSKQILPISKQLETIAKDGNHRIPHYTKRKIARLATDEDVNWLSEYLCFARSDLLEVFQARPVLDSEYSNCIRNVVEGQIGIRCTYCAHIPHSKRETARSYSFPSSLGNIYQNVAVMLHDHFGACKYIPDNVKDSIHSLKKKTSKGSANICRDYWTSSAKKLGLVDYDSGIFLRETVEATRDGEKDHQDDSVVDEETSPQPERRMKPAVIMLVTNEDRRLTSDFYFALMTRLQLVHLTDSERIGIQNKKLSVGYPGIGCRYCYQKNRRGMCRRFPLSRRVLPNNVDYLYEHIRRCTLVPVEIKKNLEYLKSPPSPTDAGTGSGAKYCRRPASVPTGGKKKEFFDRIWQRMKDLSEDHQET